MQAALAPLQPLACQHSPPRAALASAVAPSAALSAAAATLPRQAHPGWLHAAWAAGGSQQLTLGTPSWSACLTVSAAVMLGALHSEHAGSCRSCQDLLLVSALPAAHLECVRNCNASATCFLL
jgi:hypothetical protein